MRFTFQILTIAFIHLLIQNSCSGYQFYCYSCSNCGDPFSSSQATKVLCTNGCYKNVNRGDSWTVSRGCSTSSSGCSNYIYGVFGFGTYNYCCWSNNCNSSSSNSTSLGIVILFSILSKLLSYIWLI